MMMMIKLLVVFVFLQIVSFSHVQRMPPPIPQGSMPPITVRALVQPDIDALLIAHNKVRKDAQPTPNPQLTKATWDDELMKQANKLVVDCDPDGIDESSLGVNYIWTLSSNYISRDNFPTRIVTQWASQSQFYNFKNQRCSNTNGTCSAYLQLVKAASAFSFGCARSITCPSNDVVRPHTEYVVCLYSSRANGNQRPFST